MKTAWILLLPLFTGCLHQRARMSPLQAPLEKRSDSPQASNQEAPELFVRQQIAAVPIDEAKFHDGSLYNAADHRSSLFSSQFIPVKGRYIEIETRLRGKLAKNEPAPATKPTPDAEKQAMDSDLEEALKSLPDLTDEQKEELRLMKSIAFQIVDVNPAGDARVKFIRTSDNAEDYHLIEIEGIIPSESFVGGEPVTTEQLRNVKFLQVANHSRIDRSSYDWQDEYLIRLSGFSEVKSLSAKSLDEKRQQLVKTKKEVEEKLKQIGKDRQKFAEERKKYLEGQDTDRKRIVELEKSLKEKEEALKEKEEAAAQDDKDKKESKT